MTLVDHLRTREAAALLAVVCGRDWISPVKAIQLLRAACIPGIRVGGAILWERAHVDALAADLRRSRGRLEQPPSVRFVRRPGNCPESLYRAHGARRTQELRAGAEHDTREVENNA